MSESNLRTFDHPESKLELLEYRLKNLEEFLLIVHYQIEHGNTAFQNHHAIMKKCVETMYLGAAMIQKFEDPEVYDQHVEGARKYYEMRTVEENSKKSITTIPSKTQAKAFVPVVPGHNPDPIMYPGGEQLKACTCAHCYLKYYGDAGNRDTRHGI